MRLLVWFYYRKVKVFGAENLPPKGAVIIISNHQNALLDPVISCVLLNRQIHWLTRADVFRKPLVNKILRGLNMMPVYRAHDKADLRTANDPTFQECTSLLKNGAVVGLFPEGTHHGGKYLKPLKKGLARIALASLQELPDTDIYLVPVGLDYENSFHSGYDFCLSIGKPVDLKEFRALSPSDSSALQNFTQLADSVLSAEIIDLRNPEIADHFSALEDVLADIWDEEHGKNRESGSAFLSLRKTVFSPLKNQDPEKWRQTAESWIRFQHKHKFKYERGSIQSAITYRALLLELIYFLFIPFHLAFYPARWITRGLVRLLIVDIHFTSSIKILLAPIVSLLAILLLSTVIYLASNSPEMAALTPLLALVYLTVWPHLQRNRCRAKSSRILKRLKNNRESGEEWLIIRAQISNLLVKNL